MKTFILPRTGKPSVELEGENLCRVSSEKKEGREKFERWYELALYESADKGYHAHIEYQSTWNSEAPGHAELLSFHSLRSLFEALASYDPCQYCLLRPERNEQEKSVNGPKNDMVRRTLIQSFRGLVQEAANLIEYREKSLPPSETGTFIEVWIPNAIKEQVEQKRGALSWSDIAAEAFLLWIRNHEGK